MSGNETRPEVQVALTLEDCPFEYSPSRAVEMFPFWLRHAADCLDEHDEGESGHPELLRYLAAHIKKQAKPPRIEEPGPWAVVEATVPIDGKGLFLRTSEHDPQHWQDRRGDWWEWSQLIDPTLVRPGIEDQS